MSRKGTVLWIVAVSVVAVAAIVAILRFRALRPRLTTIQGAVIRSDTDTFKQEPVAGAIITATRGAVSTTTHSDASGYFRITFPQVIWPGQTVILSFSHPRYHTLIIPLQMTFRSTARRLIVAAMHALPTPAIAPTGKPATVISNIRIRYTVNIPSEENIGSAVRTFQVVNKGNVPCLHRGPCSPDGAWKAATRTISLDAGLGNEYRDVRVSCIAGPCPFTKVQVQAQGRTIVATALVWSDTATFLLEAEVFHTSMDSSVRESYPVLFGHSLSFTLPAAQEGVSIEAELNGTQIVFPIGPDVYLDWATCTVRTNPGQGQDQSIVYQCALKPGYRF